MPFQTLITLLHLHKKVNIKQRFEKNILNNRIISAEGHCSKGRENRQTSLDSNVPVESPNVWKRYYTWTYFR